MYYELDSIRYTSAPVITSDETRSFVRQMPDSCDSNGRKLSGFLLALLYTIRDGMIELLLSEKSLALIAEHDELALQKKRPLRIRDLN